MFQVSEHFLFDSFMNHKLYQLYLPRDASVFYKDGFSIK